MTENTLKTPFYTSPRPVVVRFTDGKEQLFSCPRCATGLMGRVTHWRLATFDELSARDQRMSLKR